MRTSLIKTIKKPVSLKKQSGVLLIEAMIAIFIFSLGIISIIGLQAVSVQQVTSAKYRTQAGILANQLISTMWISDKTTATLQTNFNTGGTGYNTWLASVQATLPGTTVWKPAVNVDGTNTVTVTINWVEPNDALNVHKYVSMALIK